MTEKKGLIGLHEFIKNQSVSLIGLGVSNLPLVPFLYDCGAKKVIVRDLKKKDNDPEVIEAIHHGAEVILGESYLSQLDENIVIRSPGIRPDRDELAAAERNGSYITCETELFLRFCPCRTIAITGSDGKTTTTTLVSKLLEQANQIVHLGGNIGKAILPQLKNIRSCDEFAVMELSSFQLMNCRYSPSVSIITNLSENHLDWHRDMDEYLDAKKNILRWQNQNHIAVLNADNQYTNTCEYNGKALYFSCKGKTNGLYLDNGIIYSSIDSEEKELLKVSDIKIRGIHNVQNYMAAISAVFPFVSQQDIYNVAMQFGGVEHRMEFVRSLHGVTYYNSSIDSSPARSIAALSSFQDPIIMIAGGYDKKLDYSPLGDVICTHVKHLILCGDTSEKIYQSVLNSSLYDSNKLSIQRAKDLKHAVKISQEVAIPSDVVVLSPASASFDMFRNFDERGKTFKNIVMELI